MYLCMILHQQTKSNTIFNSNDGRYIMMIIACHTVSSQMYIICISFFVLAYAPDIFPRFLSIVETVSFYFFLLSVVSSSGCHWHCHSAR